MGQISFYLDTVIFVQLKSFVGCGEIECKSYILHHPVFSYLPTAATENANLSPLLRNLCLQLSYQAAPLHLLVPKLHTDALCVFSFPTKL